MVLKFQALDLLANSVKNTSMMNARLTIDLSAIVANWRALDRMTWVETAAVVKADAYGLGIDRVAPALAGAGVREFFVATADEGATLRQILGQGPTINVFSGHMAGNGELIRTQMLTPMINSVDQMLLHVESLPGHPYGIQLNTGMNRLGMEQNEWSALLEVAQMQEPTLLMSHLACADEPEHEMNAKQLETFEQMTSSLRVRRSLAATGGIAIGDSYHFDLTRPGVGLYGGLPFVDAVPVVTLDIPVIQIRQVEAGGTVGYGNTWQANAPTQVATISAGYADGLIRAMGNGATLTYEGIKVPVIGRVSMDLITVDISALPEPPSHLQLLGQHQSVDTVAEFADTIGYEILTSLGARYQRVYNG